MRATSRRTSPAIKEGLATRFGKSSGLVVTLIVLVVAFAAYGRFAAGAGSLGSATFEVTRVYADGSEVKETEQPFPLNVLSDFIDRLNPAAVTDPEGKELNKINWKLDMEPVWTGGAASATAVTGSVKVYLWDPMTDPLLMKTIPVSYTTLMAMGVKVPIATGSLSAAEIEGFNTLKGSHIVKVEAVLNLKVTLVSDPTHPLLGSNDPTDPKSYFTYSYLVVPNGIETLGVSITGAPILKVP